MPASVGRSTIFYMISGRRLLASSVYENPKSNTNDFANQLIDDLVKVLDELVPMKKSTRRWGKQTRWLSAEAIVSRRARRRLERHYRRTKSEADRVAYTDQHVVWQTNSLSTRERTTYETDWLMQREIHVSAGRLQTNCYTATTSLHSLHQTQIWHQNDAIYSVSISSLNCRR